MTYARSTTTTPRRRAPERETISTGISTNVENPHCEGPHLVGKRFVLCRPDEGGNLAYGVGADKKKFSEARVGAEEEEGVGAG
jgi:hypothetical protein